MPAQKEYLSVGTILRVPIIRTIFCWGLYWGPLILGNYHRWGHVRDSPNSLKGITLGSILGLITGDTRSLDYRSYREHMGYLQPVFDNHMEGQCKTEWELRLLLLLISEGLHDLGIP